MDRSRPNVVELRSRSADRAEARARAAVVALAGEAMTALAAVIAGDVDMIFTAHRAVNNAIGITLDHRLRTSA